MARSAEGGSAYGRHHGITRSFLKATACGEVPLAQLSKTAIALVVALLLCSCGRRESTVRKEFFAMGTLAAVCVPAEDQARLNEATSAAKEVMSELENSLSKYKPDSDISRISRRAGIEPVPVSAGAWQVLAISKEYTRISDGAFDVTVAPLMTHWGFGSAAPQQPTADMLRTTLEHVGSEHLVLSNGTAYLERRGMGIDLGGIGKGYAVDLVYEKITGMGVSNVMVDLGGNIRCAGSPRPGVPWLIGVRNPFDRQQILGHLTLTDGMSTATSGNYEKFVQINGKRYAHILDPRTGYPVEGMAGVTVIGPNATEADAMSTTLFVLGIRKGAELLHRMGDCGALFVPDKQPIEIWVTSEFGKRFCPLPELKHRVFTVD